MSAVPIRTPDFELTRAALRQQIDVYLGSPDDYEAIRELSNALTAHQRSVWQLKRIAEEQKRREKKV